MGIDEELVVERRSTPHSSEPDDSGGQIAAGTVASHRHAPGVDAEVLGPGMDGDSGAMAVLERFRELRLGRQAIVDGEHHRAGLQGKNAAHRVVGVDRAPDVTAAMEEDEGRTSGARLRFVDADTPAGVEKGVRDPPYLRSLDVEFSQFAFQGPA